MNNRLDSQMTPRQICGFLYHYGTSKVLFPHVFNRCFHFLLRMTRSETVRLNWIVNKMLGKEKTSSTSKCSGGRIGESDIYVGLDFHSDCRRDAEKCEKSLWMELLIDQFQMSPADTDQNIPASQMLYPLFAMPRFERVSSLLNTENSPSELTFDGPSFSQVVAQMLEGLNSVAYYDELLIKPLAMLIAHTDNRRPFTMKRTALHELSLLLIADWDVQEWLSVFRAFSQSRVWVPPAAIYAATQRILPSLNDLNGEQLDQLAESMAQTPRGKQSHYCETA